MPVLAYYHTHGRGTCQGGFFPMKKRNQKFYLLLYLAMMAAMVFVCTFISIPIYTPAKTMIKAANGICLLAGLLFGGWGGLASGIGSMIFDLFDPVFIVDAPITLIRFGLMGMVCGLISHAGGAKGERFSRNLLGTIVGTLFSLVMYISYSVVKLVVAGSVMDAAIAAVVPKMITGGINAVIAVLLSMVLIKPVRKAMRAAHMLDKVGL